MSSSTVKPEGDSGPDFFRPDFPLKSSAASKRNQAIMVSLLVGCAMITVGTTLGIIYMLVTESVGFFSNKDISLWSFLTDTEWEVGRKTSGKFRHGVLPLLSGTMRITVIAMLIALPLGLVLSLIHI